MLVLESLEKAEVEVADGLLGEAPSRPVRAFHRSTSGLVCEVATASHTEATAALSRHPLPRCTAGRQEPTAASAPRSTLPLGGTGPWGTRTHRGESRGCGVLPEWVCLCCSQKTWLNCLV